MLLVLLCLIVAQTAAHPHFLNAHHARKFEEIIHGAHVRKATEYPWYGVLVFQRGRFEAQRFSPASALTDPFPFCGGSLLQHDGKSYLMSAAHCVLGDELVLSAFTKAADQSFCDTRECVKFSPASNREANVHVDFKRITVSDQNTFVPVKVSAIYLHKAYAECDAMGNRAGALKKSQNRLKNVIAVAKLLSKEWDQFSRPRNLQETHAHWLRFTEENFDRISDLALDCVDFEDPTCTETTVQEMIVNSCIKRLTSGGNAQAQIASVAEDLSEEVNYMVAELQRASEEQNRVMRIAAYGCSSDLALFELAWAPGSINPVPFTTAATPADAAAESAANELTVIGFGTKQNWKKNFFGRVVHDPVVSGTHPKGVEHMTAKSSKLRKGHMHVQPNCELEDMNPPELLFCARGFGDRATAQTTGSGDSGGPVFVETAAGLKLVGAVASGMNIVVETADGPVVSNLSDPHKDSHMVNLCPGSTMRTWLEGVTGLSAN